MDLEEIFDGVSKQMRIDFMKAQKSLSHAGLKGGANEETVRIFLKQYLPRTLDITTGTLVDSNGNESRQLDIIISDAAKTPILYQSGETRVIPVECAYAVIEVKASLNKAELKRSYSNMKSVKSLSKKAFFKPKGAISYRNTLYGKEWDFWPIHYFVFAYDSIGLNSVRDNLDIIQGTDDIPKRIDMICVLEKGVILNQRPDGKLSALPEPGSKVVVYSGSKPLLLFYTVVSLILNQTYMIFFNIEPYIRNIFLTCPH